MAAALASPCRIKRKRHRWRRCASRLWFPGQRYDAASGLNYNYFRDYEAATGRYIESDPIGLAGGVSTYGYVHANALARTDQYGLQDSFDRRNRPPALPSAAGVLSYYASEMKRVGLLEPADDVFHCVAACKAVKNGSPVNTVRAIMDLKEGTDFMRNRAGLYRKNRSDEEMMENIRSDQMVNEHGMQCPSGTTCRERCERYVRALPSESERVMRRYLASPAFNRY